MFKGDLKIHGQLLDDRFDFKTLIDHVQSIDRLNHYFNNRKKLCIFLSFFYSIFFGGDTCVFLSYIFSSVRSVSVQSNVDMVEQ